jgi:hypothetical protein
VVTRAQEIAPFALVLLALLAPAPAGADEGRFQDYAVGSRAMSLGGAFTAIADDASGIFYNPAGLVDVNGARLSLSTNLYGMELRGATPLQGAVDRLDSGVSAADLIILPSSTGAVIGLGLPLPTGHHKHAVAFGTQVPQYTSRVVETSLFDTQTGASTRFRSRLVDRTLHAGAGYSYRAGPWLRLGAAAHYVLRTIDATDSLLTPDDERRAEQFLLFDNQLRATQHSLRASLGLKLRPGPRWSVGLSVMPPSLGLWRSVELESVSIDARGERAPVLKRATARVNRIDLVSQLPAQLRAGFAFMEPGDYTVSADLIAYAPSSYEILRRDELVGDRTDFDRIALPLRVDRGPLANVAFGVEKLFGNDLSLAVGFFTNLSSADPLIVDDAGLLSPDSPRLSNVHMIGGSLSVGFFQEHSQHRLGVTGSTGFGKMVVPSAPDADVPGAPPLRAIDATQTYVYLFWSSSFRYGEGRTTRDLGL